MLQLFKPNPTQGAGLHSLAYRSFSKSSRFFGGFQVERRQARVGPEVQVIPLDTCVENLKQKLISFQVKVDRYKSELPDLQIP